ncbi:MAG: HipA domain-containing protein [Oscillospiraceae bacterium]|nr:HipA domain-containing protein [Oscillospiraceae bacterium]
MPYIDISEEVLDRLAQDSTDRGLTVPGVQKKLSLHLTEGREPRLTLVNYPTGYILKPQTEEYPALPEMEYLVMRMAQATKISTVPFALVKSAQNTFAYITKRIDRVRSKGSVSMLAMEDFCQLDGRLTEDKYRGSYERCGKLVTGYSAASGADLAELFLRVVFSFAVGNSDMHLKNFSLIEGKESSGEFTLSAAYDMLSANVVLPSDKEQLALTLNGKKQNIRRKDFLIFAETIGLPTVSAERLIQRVVAMREEYLSMCEASYLPEDMKQKLMQLIGERMAVLEKRRAEG